MSHTWRHVISPCQAGMGVWQAFAWRSRNENRWRSADNPWNARGAGVFLRVLFPAQSSDVKNKVFVLITRRGVRISAERSLSLLFLLLSMPCYFFPVFISRSCHLYSYISSSVAGGWLGLTFFFFLVKALMCVSLCVCLRVPDPVFVYVLRTSQRSVYFQSILFKDQTRGWWLIFLPPRPPPLSFISSGKGWGEERKRGGGPAFHIAQE